MFKQYNPRKRARFSIKTFALYDSSNGYLINFEVYTGQGKSIFDSLWFWQRVWLSGTDSWANNFSDVQSLSVSEKIVIHLAGHLLQKRYCLYVDNWFVSGRLARWLIEHETTITGTIKKNRGEKILLFQIDIIIYIDNDWFLVHSIKI